MLLMSGLAWVAGEGRGASPGYRFAGVGMSLAAIVIMSATVRRWAKYFVGLCLIAAAQVVFALLTGHTLSQPHVITIRPLVCLMLGMLLALIIFYSRFAAEPPRTTFRWIALVVAVVRLSERYLPSLISGL